MGRTRRHNETMMGVPRFAPLQFHHSASPASAAATAQITPTAWV